MNRYLNIEFSTYLFDITTYMNDGITVIQNYAQPLIIYPNPLTSANPIVLLNAEKTKRTIVVGSFVTMLPVPGGNLQTSATDVQGIIEIIFNSYAFDLNTGIADGGGFPCQPITGLVPGLTISDKI